MSNGLKRKTRNKAAGKADIVEYSMSGGKPRAKMERAFDPEKDRAISAICFSHYTLDTWQDCYPEAPDGSFYTSQHPDNFFLFALSCISECMRDQVIDSNAKFTSVLIGHTFYKWLSETGMPNDKLSRDMYIRECQSKMTTAERGNAFRYYFIDTSYWPYMLPVDCAQIPQTLDGKLSEEAVRLLEEYVSAYIGNPKYTVFVLPYLVPLKMLEDWRIAVWHIAREQIECGRRPDDEDFEHISVSEWEEEEGKCTLGIPILIQERHKNAMIDVGELIRFTAPVTPGSAFSRTSEYIARHANAYAWDKEILLQIQRRKTPAFHGSKCESALLRDLENIYGLEAPSARNQLRAVWDMDSQKMPQASDDDPASPEES